LQKGLQKGLDKVLELCYSIDIERVSRFAHAGGATIYSERLGSSQTCIVFAGIGVRNGESQPAAMKRLP
jgi:hypothetical protein